MEIHTSEFVSRLWVVLVLYAVGYGITMQSTWLESRKSAARLHCTLLELKFNGVTSLLYLLVTIWLFAKLTIVYVWWKSIILMMVALTLGTLVTELLLRFFGIFRGLVFLISIINLVFIGYILYTI